MNDEESLRYIIIAAIKTLDTTIQAVYFIFRSLLLPRLKILLAMCLPVLSPSQFLINFCFENIIASAGPIRGGNTCNPILNTITPDLYIVHVFHCRSNRQQPTVHVQLIVSS